MNRIVRPASVIAALLASAATAVAQPIPADKAAAAAAKVGITAVRLWSEHESVKIAPSTLPPDARAEAVERALLRYESTVNSYSAARSAMDANKHIINGAVAMAVFAAPPAAVPLILLGAASAVAHDKASEMISEMGADQGRRHLADIRSEFQKLAGVETYLELVADEKKMRETLAKHGQLLGDVEARAEAGNDPELKDLAIDLLVTTAKSTAEAALIGLANTNAALGEFVQAARASDKEVRESLDGLEKDVISMREDIVALTDSVDRLDKEMQTLGANQAIVADFVFSGLSPGEKVRAIRAGMMDARIVCPAEAPACDRAQIRTAMIERFETEATAQRRAETAGKIVQGIGNVRTIAGNLGIQLGDGDKVLAAGAAAGEAYVRFMATDYLGAIASVTSVFGNRPDPDASRHAAMMAYLEQQFAAVNKKLDQIQENQQKIFEAVVDVSRQLNEVYARLDDRIGDVGYELMVVSENVKVLIWDKWKPCWSVYSDALAGAAGERLVDRTTLGIVSLDAAGKLMDMRSDAASICIATATDDLKSLSAPGAFGNFLDIDRMIEADMPVGAMSPEEIKTTTKLTKRHKEWVVRPTTSVVRTWADRRGLSRATALAALSTHALSLESLQALDDRLKEEWRFDCERTTHPDSEPIRALVCIDGSEAVISDALLGYAISEDALLRLSDWLRVAAQVDALRFVAGRPVDWESLAAAQRSDRSAAVLKRLADTLHLAMTGVNRNYGGLTALAIADELAVGTLHPACAQAASRSANPYLAENLAIILLRRVAAEIPAVGERTPPFETVYAGQLHHALSDRPDRFGPLYALFGRSYEFLQTSDGALVMRVPIVAKEGVDAPGAGCPVADTPPEYLELPMPMPARLARGEFVLPPTFERLRASRDALVDMYLSMEFGREEVLAQAIH